MKKGKVAIGYVHGVECAITWHDSLMNLRHYDFLHKKRTLDGGTIIARFSSANVSNSRNQLVAAFLDDTQAEWLFMVDTDMVFAPNTLEALLVNANSDKDSEHYAPIVGGLCFAVNDGKLEPTMYQLVNGPDGDMATIRYTTYPKDSMFQVSATGAACLLVHRSVFLAMRERNFNTAYPFFQETQLTDKHPVGEDVTFCFRSIQLGFPVWVNTAVHVGHQKSFIADYEGHVAQVGDPHKEEEGTDGD